MKTLEQIQADKLITAITSCYIPKSKLKTGGKKWKTINS